MQKKTEISSFGDLRLEKKGLPTAELGRTKK